VASRRRAALSPHRLARGTSRPDLRACPRRRGAGLAPSLSYIGGRERWKRRVQWGQPRRFMSQVMTGPSRRSQLVARIRPRVSCPLGRPLAAHAELRAIQWGRSHGALTGEKPSVPSGLPRTRSDSHHQRTCRSSVLFGHARLQSVPPETGGISAGGRRFKSCQPDGITAGQRAGTRKRTGPSCVRVA
jgi:hypothetical protein